MDSKQNFTEGKIFAPLVKFSFPVMLALFLQAMYGAVDLFVVGQFAETADVSGVATGSMLMHTVTMVITGLAMGITILVGRKIGEKQPEQATYVIGSGIVLFFITAVIITLILTIFTRPIAIAVQTPSEAMTQTIAYIKICGAGAIFIIAYNVIGSIFRGIGDSNMPLITAAIACVVNIVCDLLFVAVFHMGASGAALATVISQFVSVIASLWLIKRRRLPFKFSKKDIRFDKNIIGRILFLGAPIALQDFLVGISFVVIQAIINTMGVVMSAGVGVAQKVCSFIMLVSSAFMQSMSAFVAQNMGAGKPHRAARALWYGIAMSVAVGMVTFYLSFFYGDILASIFDSDAEVITAAHSYLKAYAIDCIFTAFLFCFIGYYNGCGKTLFVSLQGIFSAFCIRIPIAYIVSRNPNATLFQIGLATPASTVVQIIFCMVMFFVMSKRTKNSNILS